ncbi:zinc carboxypeptidase [Streptococcus catagoni]|uniref:zinc carboxypeptidase n=1 Tax=Streptococcus catagoni TaxID=2654874 RepID=UPI00140A4B7B|nr:zinc carboxypeptidase [Streptococcus catagoni]
MTKLKTSHLSYADRVIKGLSASCFLLCSLALAQNVGAEEVTAVNDTVPALTVNEPKPESPTPVVETAQPTHSGSPTTSNTPTADTAPIDASPANITPPAATPVDSNATGSLGTSTKTEATSPSKLVRAKELTQNPATVLDSQTIYMDQENKIVIIQPSTEPITWTVEQLPEKTYDIETGGFTGSPTVTVQSQQVDTSTVYHIDIKPLFGSDLSLRWPNNIRRTYRDYIGSYTLKGLGADGSTLVTKELILRPYAAYMSHEELLKELNQIEQNHATDRLVKIETIGKSALNNDIKMGIVAKDQAIIDKYLNQTTPLMLMTPDKALALLAQGKFDYQLPILINNTHADEQPGIDVVRGLFKTFATQSLISYQTVDANKNPKTVTIDVSKLLDKVILLFDFTENPDGDIANTRALANGLDPNRDTGYQTNPETIAVVEQINKWNPIAIFDVHGFVKEFLIEPCTPPHDPNFEYDLFEDTLVAGAHEMGNAGITNSSYDSYIIPKFDYGSGWDDSFSGYTAVYGLYHGILGHTIEIPATNQASYDAGYFAVLAGIHYDLSNSDQLMKNRLNFYLRGIKKAEEVSAEKKLVTVDGSVKGRIKNGQKTFFPDYYVIPMELSAENDVDQAFKMIDYFRRNGVILNELTADTAGYHKGDLIIDMAQAKRGYANHVMYKGSDESEWPAMYAELVMNFPAMRGFKATAIYKANQFAGKLGAVTLTSAPRTAANGKGSYYIIANNSLAAVQAVNQALKNGKSVYLTNDGYVVDKATYGQMVATYPLYAKAVCAKPIGQSLRSLRVYAPGNPNAGLGFTSVSEVTLALRDMGFEVVTDPSQSDVIVLDNDQFDASILGKKPVIILGGSAMMRLEKLGILPGFDAAMTDEEKGASYEGLMHINLDANSPYTSGYSAKSLYYSNSGTWIEGVPAGFRRLANISADQFYVSGWWPSHDKLANKTVAISGSYLGQPLFIFAGNPVNKTHTINFYRWVSNAIFGTNLTTFADIPCGDSNKDPMVNHYQPETLAYHPSSGAGQAYTLEDTTNSQGLPKLGGASDDSRVFILSALLIASGGLLVSVKRRQEEK